MRDDVSGKTHLAMSQKCSMLSVPGSASHRHPGRGGVQNQKRWISNGVFAEEVHRSEGWVCHTWLKVARRCPDLDVGVANLTEKNVMVFWAKA